MSPEERNVLRLLVNDAQHARYADDHKNREVCSTCLTSTEYVTWDCETCRERLRARHSRKVAALEAEIQRRTELILELGAKLDEARAENRRLRQTAQANLRYQTEEERLEARRRTWRESKRRAAERAA